MWEYVGYMDVDKESKLYSRTYRMRVPGGWLVKVSETNETWGGGKHEYRLAVGITFLPDPEHLWSI
jgi:hypothetical protein